MNFTFKYDLISEKYGTINVKSSISNPDYRGYNGYKWKFHKSIIQPDYYICIGFDINRNNIEHVWIIPGNCKFIKKTSISISLANIGKFDQYEDKLNLQNYIKIYKTLDIHTLPEFCKLNTYINTNSDINELCII